MKECRDITLTLPDIGELRLRLELWSTDNATHSKLMAGWLRVAIIEAARQGVANATYTPPAEADPGPPKHVEGAPYD